MTLNDKTNISKNQ